ncbi:dihydrolipoamide acetyltransferase family protein [uncultured Microbulbifer sp.]|uniref:dihydrolipoamide acetyltransferase family protein n=1 Tax=uncultured Microbulbifer sp. TaxID=348147 RepID=UPI0025DB7557|nr:dihydrolipoamide acetyltransferase family protein [uncultured Microbulbifer sp.]
MSEFRLPSLGADMEDATLREWFVKPGDKFKKGDIVVAVETNKGIIDVEIYDAGTIEKILVEPDTRVPVGAVLANYVSDSTRMRISPAARRRARELGIDPVNIRGTGADGAITVEDVLAAAGPAAPSAEATQAYKPESSQETRREPGREAKPSSATELEPAAGMRQAIAAAMTRANKEIPHYYLSTSIDMTAVLHWLEQHNARRPLPERLVYAVLLLKAVALALRKVPEMNGFFTNGETQVHAAAHIAVAISLRGGGLVVPALRDVQMSSLDKLMTDFSDLVNRARGGHLRASELQDATITVTSLGEQGVETVFPIIYPPQLAIVGFGSIVERVRAVDGEPRVRSTINASLAADHRASDGHRGGLFLAEIDRLLQEPEKL